jgi:hypothetical protein
MIAHEPAVTRWRRCSRACECGVFPEAYHFGGLIPLRKRRGADHRFRSMNTTQQSVVIVPMPSFLFSQMAR